MKTQGVGVRIKNKAGRVLGTIRADSRAFNNINDAMKATMKHRPRSISSARQDLYSNASYVVTIGGK